MIFLLFPDDFRNSRKNWSTGSGNQAYSRLSQKYFYVNSVTIAHKIDFTPNVGGG